LFYFILFYSYQYRLIIIINLRTILTKTLFILVSNISAKNDDKFVSFY